MNSDGVKTSKSTSSSVSVKPRSNSGKSSRLMRSLTRKTNFRSIETVNSPMIKFAIGKYVESRTN